MKSILMVTGSRGVEDTAAAAVAARAATAGASIHLLATDARLVREGPGWGARAALASATFTAGDLAHAAVQRAREIRADLVVHVPDLAADTGPARLDAAAMAVAGRVECAVLVARHGGGWPPRRPLLPVGRAEAGANVVALAGTWLRALLEPPETPAAGTTEDGRLDVLHVAHDSREWYETGARLDAQIGALPMDARRVSCMRFGATPARRILDCLHAEPPDLLVLARNTPPATGSDAPAPDWYRVFASSRSPVLLLPAAGAGEIGPPGPWTKLPAWLRIAGGPPPRGRRVAAVR